MAVVAAAVDVLAVDVSGAEGAAVDDAAPADVVVAVALVVAVDEEGGADEEEEAGEPVLDDCALEWVVCVGSKGKGVVVAVTFPPLSLTPPFQNWRTSTLSNEMLA